MAQQPVVIVGLGNPGKEYAGTRHNIGEDVIHYLAAHAGPMPLTLSSNKKTNCNIATTTIASRPVILATTHSYMNTSGRPVRALADYYGVGSEDLVIIHDELDIDFGRVRLKRGGGEGGHNGLRSITSSFSSKDYVRVRVGIGRPPGRMPVVDFVLKKFTTVEAQELDFLVSDAADAVTTLVGQGLDPAGLAATQNQVHSR